ncbi:hypothetical protein EGW08_011751 [Elysia chlorotica]|uniref:RING-type domain-containing protein n=1 Tax=Elysia chlorotica TaxID=188477 RepID=A0A433TFW3_ELYCH|nr:hypothetical protein EGW08_011751 [Elysia chlorotica]
MGSKERLLIPYDTIEDHIHCSICLSVLRGAVLTPCGHRYCTKCITEWVGRNHSCPCCNSTLQETQFYCDVQFNGLVEAILLERDKAEQRYFDQIFNNVSEDSQDDNTSNTASQFEKILKKHLKSTLLSHQRYFNKLKEDFQRKVHLLDSGIGSELIVGPEIESEKDMVKSTLIKNLEESERLAAEAYDRHLAEHMPALDLLPVEVTVYIADKDLRIPNIVIKPADKLAVIKPLIETAMQNRCDEILKWENDSGVRLLFSPLSKQEQYDVRAIMELLPSMEDVHQLSWDSSPFFQCNLRPGSEIVLKDVFKSQSDLPKRCFANVFKESGPQPVDYFSCDNCRVKWICKSCIQCCHTGHKFSLFVSSHTPTWACCYCPKKKLCKIQDK